MLEKRVTWVRDGQARWEEDWISRHGRTKEYEPREPDLVGFANFDLKHNGLPLLRSHAGGYLVTLSDIQEGAIVRRIIQYHGFEFEDEI